MALKTVTTGLASNNINLHDGWNCMFCPVAKS